MPLLLYYYYYALKTRPLYCVCVLFMFSSMTGAFFVFSVSVISLNFYRASRAQLQSQGKMCVCVSECVFACWRGSERECDSLHLTVYDPYCCLLLYIIPASRIGHDLNKATSVHTIFSIMFLLSVSTRLTAVKQGTSVSCLNVETIPSQFMVT